VHTHFSRTVGKYLVPVLELNAKHCVGQRLYNRSFEDDGIFFRL
jgi:hypothetical protein